MSLTFPAPWAVGSYTTHDGRQVWEVRDSLGKNVMSGDSKERMEAIAASRNDSTATEDIEQITRAYQGAIDLLNADLASMRKQWHKEVASYHEQIGIYREEIAALKSQKVQA